MSSFLFDELDQATLLYFPAIPSCNNHITSFTSQIVDLAHAKFDSSRGLL